MRVEPLGLQKDLVPIPIGEAVDLVLDRRAIARPGRADRAGEQRRAMKIVGDDRVRRRVGAGDRAENLRHGPLVIPRRTGPVATVRSEEHTSELQSLMRNSYAGFW